MFQKYECTSHLHPHYPLVYFFGKPHILFSCPVIKKSVWQSCMMHWTAQSECITWSSIHRLNEPVTGLLQWLWLRAIQSLSNQREWYCNLSFFNRKKACWKYVVHRFTWLFFICKKLSPQRFTVNQFYCCSYHENSLGAHFKKNFFNTKTPVNIFKETCFRENIMPFNIFSF